MFRTCPRNLEEDRPILPAEQCGAGSLLSSNIRFMCTPCPEKKHPEHYRLSLEERIYIFNNFGLNISGTTGHQMIIQYSTSPNVCFVTTWGNRTNKIWVEMNENTSKSILNIIVCDLKKDWQILIIFGANIFDTTCHQMTVLVPTSQNVCFCITRENPNRRNRIKMQYFVDFAFPGSAEADNGCGGKLDNHLIASSVRNIGVKNYSNLIILL